MDTITIRDLRSTAIIGTLPQERKKKQQLILQLSLSGDFSRAGRSDDLHDAVNYREVEERVIACVENSSFRLIEALAEKISQECLAFPLVEEVTVCIDKPAAALRARSIGISITRHKK